MIVDKAEGTRLRQQMETLDGLQNKSLKKW